MKSKTDDRATHERRENQPPAGDEIERVRHKKLSDSLLDYRRSLTSTQGITFDKTDKPILSYLSRIR
jgi:hypothetical protein